jgi:hypothetical protein
MIQRGLVQVQSVMSVVSFLIDFKPTQLISVYHYFKRYIKCAVQTT